MPTKKMQKTKEMKVTTKKEKESEFKATAKKGAKMMKKDKKMNSKKGDNCY